MTTLSKADKLTLLNSKIRSVNYSKYGLELDLIQENAKSPAICSAWREGRGAADRLQA